MNTARIRHRKLTAEQLESRLNFAGPQLLVEVSAQIRIEDIWNTLADETKNQTLETGEFLFEFSHTHAGSSSEMRVQGQVQDGQFKGQFYHQVVQSGSLLWYGTGFGMTVTFWAPLRPDAKAVQTAKVEGTASLERTGVINLNASGSAAGNALYIRNPFYGVYQVHNEENRTFIVDTSKYFPEYGLTYYRVGGLRIESGLTITGDFNSYGSAVGGHHLNFDVAGDRAPELPVPIITELTSRNLYGVGNELRFSADKSYDPDDYPGQFKRLSYEWQVENLQTHELAADGNEEKFDFVLNRAGNYEIFLIVKDDEGMEAPTSLKFPIKVTIINVVVGGAAFFDGNVNADNSTNQSHARSLEGMWSEEEIPNSYVSTFNFNWDSAAGVQNALAFSLAKDATSVMMDLVAGLIPKKLTQFQAVNKVLAALSFFSKQQRALEQRWAVDTLFDGLIQTYGLKPDDKSIILNFIGHSRGAEVVASVAERLSSEKGVKACGLTLLDGTGTDWKTLPDLFATWPTNPGGIRFANNFRAETSLLEGSQQDFTSMIKSAILGAALSVGNAQSISWLNEPSVDAQIRAFIDKLIKSSDARAPERGGFENQVIPNSNHLSIDDIYFSSPSLLELSPLGSYTECIQSSGGSGEGPEQAADKSTLGYSLSELASAMSSSIALDLPGLDPWIQELLRSVATTGYIEKSVLNAVGSVEFNMADSSQNGNVVLRPNGGMSSFSIPANLVEANDSLIIDIKSLDGVFQPGDVLGVTLNDTIYFQKSINQLQAGRLVVPLPTQPSGVVDVRVFVSSSGNQVSATIADVSLQSNQDAGSIDFLDDKLSGDVTAHIQVPSALRHEVHAITVQVESNGIAGLQASDSVLAQVSGQTDATATFSVRNRPDGEHAFYAVIHSSSSPDVVLTKSASVIAPSPRAQNARLPKDVSRDGHVTARDALWVINALNSGLAGPVSITSPLFEVEQLDVSGDNYITPIDALLIINFLNSPTVGEGESQVESAANRPGDVASTGHESTSMAAHYVDMAFAESSLFEFQVRKWQRFNTLKNVL